MTNFNTFFTKYKSITWRHFRPTVCNPLFVTEGARPTLCGTEFVNITLMLIDERKSLSQYSDLLRDEHFRGSNPGGHEISRTRPHRQGDRPASYTTGTGSLSRR